jgi:two-component system response regulator DegU
MYLRGIKSVILKEADMEISAEVSSSDDLFNKVYAIIPDVVLLDINLSLGTGLEVTRSIKQQLPSVAVIVITPQTSNEELFEVIKVRAAGYMERDVDTSELLNTIRKAASGSHPINDTFVTRPEVAKQVLQQFQEFAWGKELETFVSPLTPRETEILQYMAKGYLNKQIAQTLSISEQTIKNHITSILRKLDANARTEAVITAIKRGLISITPEHRT